MAITKRPTLVSDENAPPLPDAVNKFVNKAPDGAKGVIKGRKRQISLTISQALLDEIDTLAEEMGCSRATAMNIAIYRAIEAGLLKK